MIDKKSQKTIKRFETGTLFVELKEKSEKIKKYIKNFSSIHYAEQIDMINHDPVLTSYDEFVTTFEVTFSFRKDEKEIEINKELFIDFESSDEAFSQRCIIATNCELFPKPAKLIFFED